MNTIYFAEVGGVRAAVNPDDRVEVGVRTRPSMHGPQTVQWIGERSWRELAAEPYVSARLVTRSLGVVLSVRCERDDSLARGGQR